VPSDCKVSRGFGKRKDLKHKNQFAEEMADICLSHKNKF
jgi:hypothetical protein